jgi:hypothetical protein
VPTGGIVVAEATSDGSLSGGYVLNVTYPIVNGWAPPPDVILTVIETYNDYYTPLGITYSHIPISF